MEKQLFTKITVIGIGLIGSSLLHAIRANGLAAQTAAFDLSSDVRAEAGMLGLADEIPETLDAAIHDADLIIVATPVGAASKVLAALNDTAKQGAMITDVGSVKESVLKAGDVLRDDLLFVPAHPVAGTEHSGPSAGFSSLFKDRYFIITPDDQCADELYLAAVDKLKLLWQGMGAMVAIMDAKHHDVALAVTSHLPHLLAFTLVRAAADVQEVSQSEVVKYAAGGFRDFSRIAASDPIMWRDVFLHNKDAVLEVLGRFSEELMMMQRAIRWGDAETIEKTILQARTIRKEIIEAGQETDLPNFGRDAVTDKTDPSTGDKV